MCDGSFQRRFNFWIVFKRKETLDKFSVKTPTLSLSRHMCDILPWSLHTPSSYGIKRGEKYANGCSCLKAFTTCNSRGNYGYKRNSWLMRNNAQKTFSFTIWKSAQLIKLAANDNSTLFIVSLLHVNGESLKKTFPFKKKNFFYFPYETYLLKSCINWVRQQESHNTQISIAIWF